MFLNRFLTYFHLQTIFCIAGGTRENLILEDLYQELMDPLRHIRSKVNKAVGRDCLRDIICFACTGKLNVEIENEKPLFSVEQIATLRDEVNAKVDQSMVACDVEAAQRAPLQLRQPRSSSKEGPSF